jgi:flagellin-like hook-associated protein FlgL
VETESMVRDTDMAKEQSTLLAGLIKQQMGAGLLAQGHLAAQAVLGLMTG